MNHRRLPLALLVCSALAWAQDATTTATRSNFLPPFGLGSTETARIDLTNVATAATGGTAASCIGNVAFVNAAGTTIGTAANFTIASGQTFSASLTFASSGLSGARGELRAVIQVTRTSGTPCSLLASLQTFDTSSGATHLYSTAEYGGSSGGGFGR